MDDKVGLVFSWDPRAKTWLKERGPDDGAPPPVPPIDDGAVQTYFLDPANGRWNGTILGLKARQISVELKDAYRAPYVPGLALPRPRAAAADARPSSKVPLVAALGVLLVLAAGGAFAAQAMLSPAPSAPPPAPTQAAAGTAASTTAAAASASATATAAPATTPGGAATPPPRTAAPTPPPTPQTQRLSVRLPNGTQVFYSGPASVAQGTTFQAIFSVVLPSGQGGNENLTVYLGDPNAPGASTSALASKPDPNGNYVLNLRAAVPKGDQRLAVVYGTVAGIHTLGTINIR